MTGRWRIRVRRKSDGNVTYDSRFIVQQYGGMIGYPADNMRWAQKLASNPAARRMSAPLAFAVNPILDPREEPS